MGYWACAQIDRRHERWALHCLALSGLVVYQPRIIKSRSESEPLFANYLFVAVEMQWHLIRWSPGVLKLLMSGEEPARVPDRLIAELRAREGRDGLVRLPKSGRPNNNNGAKFQIGDTVRIAHGAFSGFHGLVEGMKGRERVEILLQLLGRVEIAESAVERLASSP
jgi:transcriptional antiterminator RfaH